MLNSIFVPRNIAIGDITEISCSIKRGSLPVQFKWLHNGKEVHSHPRYKITTSEASSQFFIGKIQASDIGNFTCMASNSFGSDSVTESVFMEGENEGYESFSMNSLSINTTILSIYFSCILSVY